jgi:hypothetical protein
MADLHRLRGVGIGAGYFAPFQYDAWTRIPEVEIVAIYNRTAERARPLMSQYGIARFYEDWKVILEEAIWTGGRFSPRQHCPPSIHCGASPRPGART